MFYEYILAHRNNYLCPPDEKNRFLYARLQAQLLRNILNIKDVRGQRLPESGLYRSAGCVRNQHVLSHGQCRQEMPQDRAGSQENFTQ